jgi:hypothetical protein
MVNVEGSTARLEIGARHGVAFEWSAILDMESEPARALVLFRKQ